MPEITRTTALGDLPELLRIEEVAAYLGISKWLAYELARRGDLPSVRLGRLLRIKREGLAERQTSRQNTKGENSHGER